MVFEQIDFPSPLSQFPSIPSTTFSPDFMYMYSFLNCHKPLSHFIATYARECGTLYWSMSASQDQNPEDNRLRFQKDLLKVSRIDVLQILK